jgi:uncharacterized coiled-coil protein SlyX
MDLDSLGKLAAIIGSVIAVIVSLITAATAAKSSAVVSLQALVASLQSRIEGQDKTIEKLNRDLSRERRLRMAYEDYIHALLLRFREKKITPPNIKDYVSEEDEEG